MSIDFYFIFLIFQEKNVNVVSLFILKMQWYLIYTSFTNTNLLLYTISPSGADGLGANRDKGADTGAYGAPCHGPSHRHDPSIRPPTLDTPQSRDGHVPLRPALPLAPSAAHARAGEREGQRAR